jgi:spore coat protein CotH
VLISCGKNDLIDTPIVEQETEVEQIEIDENANYLNEKSDYIFDDDKLLTFNLNLSSTALSKIDSNPAAEEYVEGSLTFEGETVQKVGIRYKGSIGSFVGCLSNRDWANPSGFKTCTKLSMKIKMNWQNSDDTFFGLKKLQFHSMNNDDSQLRERLGYRLFREMGVPAPRSVHARLFINGKYVGLFALTEQIDGRFTKQNFEDGNGNLYKEIWPLRDNGQPYLSGEYTDALKTNEDENPSVEQMMNFAQELAEAGEEDLKSVVEKWMDIEEIMSYIVVDRAIRNDDGIYHWYCNANECTNHNFYWYENPIDETMHLIPWDLDNAFENISYDSNPVTPVADDWNQIRNECQPFGYGIFLFPQRSASCDKLMRSWTFFEDDYNRIASEFKQSYFSESIINGWIDKWSDQIREATKEASELHGDAITMQRWERYIITLKSDMDFARTKL